MFGPGQSPYSKKFNLGQAFAQLAPMFMQSMMFSKLIKEMEGGAGKQAKELAKTLPMANMGQKGGLQGPGMGQGPIAPQMDRPAPGMPPMGGSQGFPGAGPTPPSMPMGMSQGPVGGLRGQGMGQGPIAGQMGAPPPSGMGMPQGPMPPTPPQGQMPPELMQLLAMMMQGGGMR